MNNKEVRERVGLSKDAAGRLAGVPRTQLEKWEREGVGDERLKRIYDKLRELLEVAR